MFFYDIHSYPGLFQAPWVRFIVFFLHLLCPVLSVLSVPVLSLRLPAHLLFPLPNPGSSLIFHLPSSAYQQKPATSVRITEDKSSVFTNVYRSPQGIFKLLGRILRGTTNSNLKLYWEMGLLLDIKVQRIKRWELIPTLKERGNLPRYRIHTI